MELINTSTLKNGESRSYFERLNPEEVLEVVVQKRVRKIVDIQANKTDIETSSLSLQTKVVKDQAYINDLDNVIKSNIGDEIVIDNTH